MFDSKGLVAVIIVIILTVTLVGPICSGLQSKENTLDVIVIDGQSNAEYSPSSLTRCNKGQVGLPDPKYDLLYYGSESAANNYWTDSTGIYSMNRGGYWQIGGLEPTLAYYYSLRAGHDVLTINVAKGATSITWLAGSDGLAYATETIDTALGLVQGYSKINMVGWLWLQGEKDKAMAIEDYKSYFIGLMDYFESYNLNFCYIAKTREYYGGNATIAQEELVSEYSNIYMTDVTDSFTEQNGLLVNNDPIHYSQKGRNVIGETIGNMMVLPENPDKTVQDLLSIIPIIIAIGVILLVVRLILGRVE